MSDAVVQYLNSPHTLWERVWWWLTGRTRREFPEDTEPGYYLHSVEVQQVRCPLTGAVRTQIVGTLEVVP